MTVIGDPRQAGEEGPAGDMRAPGEDGPAGDPRHAGEAEVFDPAEHTVAEVKEHIAELDEGGAAAVVEAERSGKGRKTIVAE